jgi:hypothetical protein
MGDNAAQELHSFADRLKASVLLRARRPSCALSDARGRGARRQGTRHDGPAHGHVPGAAPARDKMRAVVLRLATRILSDKDLWSGYRVTVPYLREGGVGVVFSALYRPFEEMDLSKPDQAPPAPAYFARLLEDLAAVEEEVATYGSSAIRVVHNRSELEQCLGDVRHTFLRQRVTVAHLFFRQSVRYRAQRRRRHARRRWLCPLVESSASPPHPASSLSLPTALRSGFQNCVAVR